MMFMFHECVDYPTAAVPMREQYLHHNAMQQPDTIIENGYTATFSYYGDRSRAGMTVTGPDGYKYSCDYHDQRYNYFTKTQNGITTHKTVLWLGGSPYGAPAAMLKDYKIIYKSMRYREGVFDGINEVVADKTRCPAAPYYYNLMGQPVGTTVPTTPGIYIHQGRKVVVR